MDSSTTILEAVQTTVGSPPVVLIVVFVAIPVILVGLVRSHVVVVFVGAFVGSPALVGHFITTYPFMPPVVRYHIFKT